MKTPDNSPASATFISQVATVFVPVADSDRALEFYVEKLGFEKRADFTYGAGFRWIEVCPPGSPNAIALVPAGEGEFVGDDKTYCAFTTTNIEADYETLCARGVNVEGEIGRAGTRRAGLLSVEVSVENPVPPQFIFRDIDGNRFLIVEPKPPGA